MKLYVPVTFLFLALAYYQMSGGPGFVPEARPVAQVAKAPATETRVPLTAAAETPAEEPAAPVEPVVAVAAEPAPAIEAAPEPAPEPVMAEAPALAEDIAQDEPQFVSLAAPREDRMVVNASSLNVRSGPSTGEAVVGRLVAGDEVSVALADSGNGWTLIRVEGDGIEGWVATRFLSP